MNDVIIEETREDCILAAIDSARVDAKIEGEPQHIIACVASEKICGRLPSRDGQCPLCEVIVVLPDGRVERQNKVV